MRLAPIIRVDLSIVKKEILDKCLKEQNTSESYLKCLKEGTSKPLSSGKTWPLSDKDDDDVMIVGKLVHIDLNLVCRIISLLFRMLEY